MLSVNPSPPPPPSHNLPHLQAYRDWGVELYDWQSQSSMLAEGGGLTATSRRMMPTVGAAPGPGREGSTSAQQIVHTRKVVCPAACTWGAAGPRPYHLSHPPPTHPPTSFPRRLRGRCGGLHPRGSAALWCRHACHSGTRRRLHRRPSRHLSSRPAEGDQRAVPGAAPCRRQHQRQGGGAGGAAPAAACGAQPGAAGSGQPVEPRRCRASLGAVSGMVAGVRGGRGRENCNGRKNDAGREARSVDPGQRAAAPTMAGVVGRVEGAGRGEEGGGQCMPLHSWRALSGRLPGCCTPVFGLLRSARARAPPPPPPPPPPRGTHSLTPVSTLAQPHPGIAASTPPFAARSNCLGAAAAC